MTDRPIIFSGAMVLALLAGRKTQTRRVLVGVPTPPADDAIVHEPRHKHAYFDAYCGGKKTSSNPRGMTDQWCWWTRDDRAGHGCKVGYVPGDRLWVRENHYRFGHWEPVEGLMTKGGRPKWAFVADRPEVLFEAPAECRLGRHHRDPATPAWHARLGRFMFRDHSRMTLLAEDVRVERLQSISRADAIAEGLTLASNAIEEFWRWPEPHHENLWLSPPAAYRHLWTSLHGPDAWDLNPWVVAVTFRIIQQNIDKIREEAA